MKRPNLLQLLPAAALLGALASIASAQTAADTQRSHGSQLAAAGVTSWTQARIRQASLDAHPHPRMSEGDEEEEAEWWETLPAEDRKYIARGEYQDPYAIIAA